MRHSNLLRLGLLSCLFASGGLASTPAPAVPPRLPAKDFSRFRVVSGAAVSGDGKSVAYQAGYDKGWTFIICDWDNAKTLVSEDKAADDSTPVWINDDIATNGAGGLDRTGNPVQHWWESSKRYMAARFGGSGNAVFLDWDAKPDNPDFMRVDTKAGRLVKTVESPVHASKWMVDGAGLLRAVVQQDKKGVKTRVLYRPNEDSPWVVPAGLEYAEDAFRPHWLSADGKLLYFSKVTAEGTWGIFSYDLEKQQTKECIVSHAKFDLRPADEAVVAPVSREILGFHYEMEKPGTIWFDPQMQAVQEALDRILPNRRNAVTSVSDSLKQIIVLSSSARDPGAYYRFDLEKKSLKPLFPVLPWIKPERMAEVYPISYKARDGLVIHGYLTLPVGRAPKNLPLVVFPHGNLLGRDSWGFDLDCQFLANRGYAVLQMNYRGSSGYGKAFQEKAYRRFGHEVQDDITDGARWAIAEGLADPKRIAIMGYGFGGYSALMGVIRNPGLYQCAINIGGQTDWVLKKGDLANYDLFKEHFGDLETDVADLREASPINHAEQVGAPVLLVYDAVQDYFKALRDQHTAFTRALDRAHRSYEAIDTHNEFKSIFNRKNREEFLLHLEKFLAQNVPTDVLTPAQLN